MSDRDKSTDSDQLHSGRGKVSSLLDQYHLPDLGDELVECWTREEGDRMSLRELADYFNKALLAETFSRSSIQTLDGEVSNYYRLLTEDEVSSGTRIEAENRLEQQGVDVEQLRENFVSRQAIHTYLTKERSASYEQPTRSNDERTESRIEGIGRLKNRLIAVTERAISDLLESDQLPSDEIHVTALVQVHCASCGAKYSVSEFLSNGGCKCRSSHE